MLNLVAHSLPLIARFTYDTPASGANPAKYTHTWRPSVGSGFGSVVRHLALYASLRHSLISSLSKALKQRPFGVVHLSFFWKIKLRNHDRIKPSRFIMKASSLAIEGINNALIQFL
ncbi:hypothetical protein TB2_024819 [Malus domestica]